MDVGAVGGTGHERAATVAAEAWGRPGDDAFAITCEPAAAHLSNMTTNAIHRYRGTFSDGTPWSLIAKVLHPASESPLFAAIPPDHHASTLAALNWLDEPAWYRSGIGAELSGALRLPTVHAIDDAPGRITIWMEDVVDRGTWDLDRYHRTARAIGGLGARWTADEAAERFGLGHRDIGGMFFGKVCNFDLVMMGDDGFWRRPDIDAVVDLGLRDDLFRLVRRMPDLIRALDDLPRGVCHGDATATNFHEPGDGTVVAIDWSYGNVDALGSDLAQLLAGRFESGDALITDLDRIAATILDGYVEGLMSHGCEVDPRDLRRAWATHMAIRSVFAALTDELPGVTGAQRTERLRSRAALARFGIDLTDRLP